MFVIEIIGVQLSFFFFFERMCPSPIELNGQNIRLNHFECLVVKCFKEVLFG